MSDRDLILKLARVIIAVAWADGEISHEEINSLKDLLFHLRTSAFDDSMQFSGQEWARLDMYIETPVGDEERARLVVGLQNSLRSASDKQVVVDALQRMIAADGEVSQEEREMVAQIQGFDERETKALLDYVSRLEPPEALQAPAGWYNPDFGDPNGN